MFTGLVEEVGVIRRVDRWSEGARLAVGAHKVLEGTDVGDSIAVSGACLTVIAVGRQEFVAECMAETLSRTTLGDMTAGVAVNLERALALNGRMGGHLVLGHVDAVVAVRSIDARGDALEICRSRSCGPERRSSQ
jgi:riboflavin synthase